MVAGDAVYLTTAAGSVHALHVATGEQLWTRRVAEPAAATPTTAEELVVLTVGQVGRYGHGAAMVGLDAATGEQRWEYTVGEFAGVAAATQRGRVLVSRGDGRLLALDAATGGKAWQIDLSEPERNRGPYSHIFTINTPVTPTDGRVIVHISTSVCYCLDDRNGTVVWRTPHGSHYNSYSTAAVLDGVAYLGSGDGGLVAVDTRSGEIRYEGRPAWEDVHAAVGWPDPTERSPVIDSRLVVIDEAVCFGARNGFLCHYQPGRGVRLLGNLAAGWGAPQPVPAGTRLLALWPKHHIGAFDTPNAIMLWRGRLRGCSTGIAATEAMFCYGRGRNLLAHDAGTGQGPKRGFVR